MAFELPGGLVTFQRMKVSASPVQVKTAGGGGIDLKIKAFPNTRPSLTMVSQSVSNRGHFSTGLTQEEQDFLEPKLGLAKGELSSVVPDLGNPEKVRNCYWLQQRAFMEIPVHKPRILDLSIPLDYLHYKALSQLKTVEVGMAAYNANPEAEYVMIKEEDVVKEKYTSISSKKKAYQFIRDWTTSNYSDYLFAQGQDPRHLSPDALEGQVGEAIEKNPDYFLKQVQDPTYKEKVLIGEWVRLGAIIQRGKSYTTVEGAPLASSLEEMVDFLSDKQKQGVKLEIMKLAKQGK